MFDFIFDAVRLFWSPFRSRLPIEQREVEYEILFRYLENFEHFFSEDIRHQQMRDSRKFFNNPGEIVRMPQVDPLGIDRTRRQIQYGLRGMSAHREVYLDEDGRPRIRHRAAAERGAAIVYSRADNYVTQVILYLPSTDRMKPIDEAYIIDALIPGVNMTSIGRLERHAKLFRSVAERYSFDGEPDFLDFIRTFRLRWFHKYVSDNKAYPPRINGIVVDIAKWVITVGLSGFVIQWIFF